MNYRHAYHAGNFADVLKHAVLALVIDYLKRKEAPFRVIDTHAGRGRYALDLRGGRQDGRMAERHRPPAGPGRGAAAAARGRLLAPYLDAVRAENDREPSALYPGSPLIAQPAHARPGRCWSPTSCTRRSSAALKAALGRDRRVKVMALDGWLALKSLLPPKERRGRGADRPAVRAGGRAASAWRTGSPRDCGGSRPASSSPGIRSRTCKPVARFRARDLAGAPGAAAACRTDDASSQRSRPPQRLRAHRRQSALSRCMANSKRSYPEMTRRMAEDAGARYHLRAARNSLQDRQQIGPPKQNGVCAASHEMEATICLAPCSANHRYSARSSGGPSTRRRLLRLS